MKRLTVVAFISALGIVAGCAPTQQQYAAIQETVRGSAKARQFAVKECSSKGWNRQSIRNAAIVLDTSERAAPELACRRLVEAVRSGRLSYSEAVAASRKKITPELVKILQGR